MVLKCFLIHRPDQCDYILYILFICTSLEKIRNFTVCIAFQANNKSTSSSEQYITQRCREENREHTEYFTVIKSKTAAE